MPDFLILRRTGPQPTDLEICTVIQGRGGDEGEQAILEGAHAGEGRYLAVSMGNTTERELAMEPVLKPPEPEGPPPAEESIPQDEPPVAEEAKPPEKE